MYDYIANEIAYGWSLVVIQCSGLLTFSGIRESGFYLITVVGHYSWRVFCNSFTLRQWFQKDALRYG